MCPVIHLGTRAIPAFQLFIILGYLTGALTFWFLSYRYINNKLLNRLWFPVIGIVFFIAILGAQLNSLSYLNWKNFLLFPVDSSWHKGLLIGIITILIFFKAVKAPLLKTLDLLSLALLLGHAIGRIGCFMAGDGCYGKPTHLPWAMAFPHGAAPVMVPVHPVPLYESFILIFLFAVLLFVYKKNTMAGTIWGLYCVAVGSERFLLEFLRLNSPVWGGLTEPQLIFATFVAFGIIFLLALKYSHHNFEMLGTNGRINSFSSHFSRK